MDFKGWKQVPKEIRDTMAFCIAVKSPGSKRTVSVFAEKYEEGLSGILRLTNVLVDTSAIHDSGMVIDEVFSHVDWILIGGSHAWTLRPIALEEK